jgi:carbon storage regulator CsrA
MFFMCSRIPCLTPERRPSVAVTASCWPALRKPFPTPHTCAILPPPNKAKGVAACSYVLTRREGDTVILKTSDGPIDLSIAEINGSQIRVGFEAPKSVAIVRGELKERDQKAT